MDKIRCLDQEERKIYLGEFEIDSTRKADEIFKKLVFPEKPNRFQLINSMLKRAGKAAAERFKRVDRNFQSSIDRFVEIKDKKEKESYGLIEDAKLVDIKIIGLSEEQKGMALYNFEKFTKLMEQFSKRLKDIKLPMLIAREYGKALEKDEKYQKHLKRVKNRQILYEKRKSLGRV